MRDKTHWEITFTPKQISEVNHSKMINNYSNAKPSGFIFYVETITYLKSFNLQDFTFKTRKQSFASSFSLCMAETLNWSI